MPQNRSSNVERKSQFTISFEYFVYINFIWLYASNIYFIVCIVPASAYDRSMQPHAFLAMCDVHHKQKKQRLAIEADNIKPDVV